MKVLKVKLNLMRHMSFKRKLVSIYSMVILLIACGVAILVYNIGVTQIMDISKNMAYEIQQKNIRILDERLMKIKENSMQAATDDELFGYLINEDVLANQNYLGLDRKITQVLNKYFSSYDVMSVQLITDTYIYGVNTNLLTAQRFKESSLYQNVLDYDGVLLWTPVYDIVNMYSLEEYRESALPNRWVFSAARTLGKGYITKEGFFESKSFSGKSQPILLINFSESILNDVFQDSMSVQGVDTYLLSAKGDCIYHSGLQMLDEKSMQELYERIGSKNRGTDIILLNGKKVAVSYVTSDVTSWISVAIMPPNKLMRESRTKILMAALGVALVAMLIGILISSFVSSMVTRPIKQTVEAMHELGAGRFDTQLEIKSRDDFGYLAEGFNIMNQHISRLIEENYASKLRENEMEMMALNLQLNPHFLYNTLSVINYEALDSGCSKVSDMIMHLCNMLNYTLRNNNETSLFYEDLQWLQNYVDIMKLRFEDKFTVSYDIPASLMNIQVPKLFLQPFIENSILHGFANMASGGQIEVCGHQEQDICIIEVRDNGIGMKNIEEQLNVKHQVGSIGIANMQKRISLLYGEKYGIKILSREDEGTRIIISIPMK